MKTELVVLKGKCKWAKVQIPDATFGDPSYRMDLYLTPESIETFKSLKVKNKLNQDQDGAFIHLKRDTSKIMKGQRVQFNPPVLTNKDGTPFTDSQIGNGSDVTVSVEYYGWGASKGVLPGYAIRLYAIQVDNLVNYEPNRKQEQSNEAASLPSTP